MHLRSRQDNSKRTCATDAAIGVGTHVDDRFDDVSVINLQKDASRHNMTAIHDNDIDAPATSFGFTMVPDSSTLTAASTSLL
jgi:hypothetical protein